MKLDGFRGKAELVEVSDGDFVVTHDGSNTMVDTDVQTFPADSDGNVTEWEEVEV